MVTEPRSTRDRRWVCPACGEPDYQPPNVVESLCPCRTKAVRGRMTHRVLEEEQ